MKRRYLLFAVILLLSSSGKLLALGVFEDFHSRSYLLTDTLGHSISASLLRAEKGDRETSGFFLTAAYPLKKVFLLRAEFSYFSVSKPDGISRGFGDFLLDGRAAVFHRTPFKLFLTGGLRTGSGTRVVYPYASGSVDVRWGVGFVDSLSQFTLWGELTMASVSKAPPNLDKARMHGNYSTAGLGFIFDIRANLSVDLGGAGYFLRRGGTRNIYFAGISYTYSRLMECFASLQVEAGDSEERVNDFALKSGLIIKY